MTSVISSFKQISTDSAYFITVAATRTYTPASVEAVAANGSGALTVSAAPLASMTSGILLKDMGKTVMAKLTNGITLFFRKVQYVNSSTPETNGISGAAPGDGSDYTVGYALLGVNGTGGGASSGDASYVKTYIAKYGA
jgi:hypothetical protein